MQNLHDNYRFFRKETGEWEVVAPETWRWEAHYLDRSVLKQFGDDGIFHQFAEIDQEKLAVFRMVSPEHAHVYTLLFEPGMKLIHFYRRTRLNVGTPDERHLTTHCFGYEKGREKRIFLITPTNELVITDNPDNVTVT